MKVSRTVRRERRSQETRPAPLTTSAFPRFAHLSEILFSMMPRHKYTANLCPHPETNVIPVPARIRDQWELRSRSRPEETRGAFRLPNNLTSTRLRYDSKILRQSQTWFYVILVMNRQEGHSPQFSFPRGNNNSGQDREHHSVHGPNGPARSTIEKPQRR